ncbi:MAG: hypothetical protein ABEI11_01490 [Haloarculaceae archaeon]
MSAPTSGSPIDLDALRPDRRTLLWGAILVNTELLIVLAYFWAVGGTVPTELGYLALVAYPFVWLNVSAWALRRASLPPASPRRRLLAAAVGIGYFMLLSRVGGLLLPGIGARATGLRFVLLDVPPGFAPALLYSGEAVVINLIPFQLVGYATLAYLVAVTVLDAAGNAAAGLLGLFSCVSCALPVLAAVTSGLAGGGAAVVATMTSGSYGLSTAAFLLTVLLLSWRPDAGDLGWVRARLAGDGE